MSNNSRVQTFHKIQVEDGVKIWYREAGDINKPHFLLLHGYPTSSNMFRHLIPFLAPHFHVIAPDLPGFGFTETPESYEYSFSSVTRTIEHFVDILKLSNFAIYIFDYGAPVGLRLALKRPTSITAIVTQNGNAYEEGIDDRFWAPIKRYWQVTRDDPSFVGSLSEFIRDRNNIVSQYLDGVSNSDAIEPSAYVLDEALLKRPGQTDIQLDFFYDYQNNVKLYPQFQEYLRSAGIPVLVFWGKNDYIFSVAGAEAYKRDAKESRVRYFDSGHFALEDHVVEIAEEIKSYLLPRI